MLKRLKISLNYHYCSDVTVVPDIDIGTALTSQQYHMPDIGTPASFELVWYHAIINIIESVDSICRDSADTQYMLIQTNLSKSPKQLTFKPL